MAAPVANEIECEQTDASAGERCLPARSNSLDRTVLLMSAAVIFLSFVLTTRGERDVIIPGLSLPLPGLCMSQRLLGIDCPGCGLTRSFISLAHGDFASAWQFNPVGFLMFVFVAAQIPFRLWQISRRKRCLPVIEMGAWSAAPLAIIAGLLFLQWAIKMSGRLL